MKPVRLLPLATLLLAGGCTLDYADGYAPNYPAGYDSGMGSGQFNQPGDQFGGQDVASIDVFLAPLTQYGRWTDSRYGRAFLPNAPQGWRPYVNGRWGENRLWISDDPWGWATDHYGRWGHDDRIGWVWVPGTEWAPSWVAWREDEQQDVAGWAPIPPGIAYSVGVGFGTGFGSPWGYDNYNSWYGPSWVWVPRGNIYRPGFGGGTLPWQGGNNYWRGSHWNHNGGYNRGHNGNNNAWNNNGRPGGGRPNGGRPNDGRPYTPRPGVGEAIGGSIAGLPPRGRPGGAYQGNNRPSGQYQGTDGQYQGRPSGQYQGTGTSRPPRNTDGGTSLGESIGGNMARPPAQQTSNRPAQPAYNPPQQAYNAPTPRAERPEPPQRQSPATPERSDERPQ
nr:DUF6600 domain-containing protein [Polymorphobacter sp.]